MTINDLKIKLETLKIPTSHYSLDGELLADRIILYSNYAKYEVFYLDERGGKNEFKIFERENAACNYVLKLFEDQVLDKEKFGINI